MRDDKYGPLAVMVIDDSELDRKYLKALCDGIGVGTVLAAESGNDALQQLEATEAEVDMIICDVEMPELNGFEFTRRIRYGLVPRFKDVPIVLLTGHSTQKHLEYAQTHKISDLVEKPLTADFLKVEIEKVLGI